MVGGTSRTWVPRTAPTSTGPRSWRRHRSRSACRSGSARPSSSCESSREPTAMAIALRYAARSDLGLLRSGNEDSGYAGPRLLVVADGVGGHAAGEVASSVTVSVLAALDEEAPGGDLLDRLSSAVNTANT